MGKPPTTALLTDQYQLTMVDAALQSGVASRRAVFEVFARSLPAGRRYGVFCGTGRLVGLLTELRFSAEDIRAIEHIVSEPTQRFLAGWRFSGTIRAYREGECYFPRSPVITVESTYADGQLLETLVLSAINHDSAIASAASRMRTAAGNRRLIEMGSRRTHEEAAVASARAAYIAGFDATSNLEAARRYGIPTAGTIAHSFILSFPNEQEAVRAQLDAAPSAVTALVDTYDIEGGIRAAIATAGERLGAVRIDSGDIGSEAALARSLLDEAGLTSTQIICSGDLDEYSLADLAGAPVDVYGIGTAVVTGSGHPTVNFVYKLVSIEDSAGTLRPVAKLSPGGKATTGGMKAAARMLDPDGRAVAEFVGDPAEVEAARRGGRARPLQVDLVVAGVPAGTGAAAGLGEGPELRTGTNPDRVPGEKAGDSAAGTSPGSEGAGKRVGIDTLTEQARGVHRASLSELPDEALLAQPGTPALVVQRRRGRVLIVVDVQYDFCEGGPLAVKGGNAVAEQIAAHIAARRTGYDYVVATRDWHEDPGGHFSNDPDYDESWPPHCVAGTPGAELHGALSEVRFDGIFDKGRFDAAYSAFQGFCTSCGPATGGRAASKKTSVEVEAGADNREGSASAGRSWVGAEGTSLGIWLDERHVGSLDIAGIATDYCVRATVLDALAAGFGVRLLAALSAGVAADTAARAVQEMCSAGAVIVETELRQS